MAKKTKKQTKENKTSGARTTTTSLPATVGTKIMKQTKPTIQTSTGGMRIKHSEYCNDVYQNGIVNDGSTYRLNPQNTQIFPWLAAIATRFEMYKFHKLSFRYAPSVGSTQIGFVVMAFDFDYNDVTDTFPPKSTLLTWKYSSKSTPWQNNSLDITEDAKKAPFKYSDTSRVDSNTSDARFDNLGNLYILASANGASSLFVGELFVDYEVEFIQPSYKVPSALYYTITNTGLPGADQPFAGAPKGKGNMNVETNPATPGYVTIKDAGQFIVELIETGTSITSALSPLATGLFPGSNATSSELLRKYSSDGTKSILTTLLNVKIPPVQLQYGGGNGLGLSSDLKISTYRA